MPYAPSYVPRALPGVQPDIFKGRQGFVKLGHFNKLFVKNTRKKGEKFWSFFPRYSENYIFNERFNPRIDTIRTFFLKIRALLGFSKKSRGGLPPIPP